MDWTPVVITGTAIITFYMIIKTISNNRLRSYIVDRGTDQELVKEIFKDVNQFGTFSSNKFGLVFIFVGVAVIVGELLLLDEEMLLGLYSISIGVALLLAPKLQNILK